jgi:hypothetical protein
MAPAGIVVAASWDDTAGPLSGTILTRIAAADPRFGPALIPVVGGTQPNPLATTNRFKYSTRGEGQVEGPPIRILNIKAGKKFKLGMEVGSIPERCLSCRTGAAGGDFLVQFVGVATRIPT